MTSSKTQREMDENNPRCCSGCFATPVICDWIEHNGVVGLCSFCGAGDRKTVEPVQLEHLFRAAVGLCVPEPTLSGADFDSLKSGMLDPLALHEIFHWRWRTFSPALWSSQKSAELLALILTRPDIDQIRQLWILKTTLLSSDSPVVRWQALCTDLKHSRRYGVGEYGANVERRLDELLKSDRLEKLTSRFSQGYYRARIGKHKPDPNKIDDTKYLLGAPPHEKARAGRANASGIRVLYASSTRSTAVAEVRAKVGQIVSIVEVIPRSDRKLLDLRSKHGTQFFSPVGWTNAEELRNAFEFSYVVDTIGRQFSRPVQVDEDFTGYVPTQYLAEFILSKSFDGVLYDSELEEGFNIVLFDCDNVDFGKVESIMVQKIKYEIATYEEFALIEPFKSMHDAVRRSTLSIRNSQNTTSSL